MRHSITLSVIRLSVIILAPKPQVTKVKTLQDWLMLLLTNSIYRYQLYKSFLKLIFRLVYQAAAFFAGEHLFSRCNVQECSTLTSNIGQRGKLFNIPKSKLSKLKKKVQIYCKKKLFCPRNCRQISQGVRPYVTSSLAPFLRVRPDKLTC